MIERGGRSRVKELVFGGEIDFRFSIGWKGFFGARYPPRCGTMMKLTLFPLGLAPVDGRIVCAEPSEAHTATPARGKSAGALSKVGAGLFWLGQSALLAVANETTAQAEAPFPH